MSITLVIDDFKQPDGELFADLFPGQDIDTLLSGWLAKASDLITASDIDPEDWDAAAEAYVYYRAYNYVAQRLAGTANSISIDSGAVTKSMSNDQRGWFNDRATYWLGIYDGFFTVTPKVPTLSFFKTVKARSTSWPC